MSVVQILVVGSPALCLSGMINSELCNPIHTGSYRLAESRMKMLLLEEFYITASDLPPEPTWMNGHSAWLLLQNELSCHHLRCKHLPFSSVGLCSLLTDPNWKSDYHFSWYKNSKPSGLLPTYQELVIQIETIDLSAADGACLHFCCPSHHRDIKKWTEPSWKWRSELPGAYGRDKETSGPVASVKVGGM